MAFGLFKLNRDKVVKQATQGNFSNKNLAGFDLSGIRFTQAEFNGADLSGANLSGSEFVQCEFKGANLSGAHVQGARFSQCEFRNTQTQGVQLANAELSQCDGLSFEQHRPSYSYWSDEQKVAIGHQLMHALQPILGGQVHHDTEEETIELRTQIGERLARIVLDLSWGSFDVEMRFVNTLGLLELKWDPSKEARDESQSAWDQNAEVRHLVGPGVFIEEYANEAKQMIMLASRFPQVVSDIA